MGSSIQVVTQEFMNDIAATNINDLLQYTTSTETAGISGNFTGADFAGNGVTDVETSRRNPSGANRIRGMAAPDRTRDFFKTEIPFDTYNTERVDINRGANSFLFGLGSPAGLINNGLAKAHFSNFGEVGFRIDSGGADPSYRGSIDLNRVLVEDVLAVRISGLYDHTKFYQRPTFQNDERFYMALTYKPFGRESGTTIRAHYETGKINGTPPSVVLPVESLSRFLNQPDLFPERPNVERVMINPVEFAREYGRSEGPYFGVETGLTLRDLRIRPNFTLRYDGTGPDGINSLGFLGQVRGAEVTNGNAYFDPNNIGTPNQDYVFFGNRGEIMRSGTGSAAWADQGFVNLDTFDFSKYNLGWDGEFYKNSFDNYNVSLEHVFLNQNAGINISFDYQDFDRASYTIGPDPDGAGPITLDINTHMLYPTAVGSLEPAPNPNFGRPVMMTRRFNTHESSETTRKTTRATLFYKLNFTERDDWAKWLGNHTFTFLADREEQDIFRHGSRPSSFAGSFDVISNLPGRSTDPTIFSRDVPFMVYLGPPQLNAFTDPNFSLEDFVITADNGYDFSFDAIAGQHDTFYWDRATETWKRGTFTAREISQRDPNLQNILIESQALNLSSEFLGGNLIVNTGYREDKVDDVANRTPPRDAEMIPVVTDRSLFNLHNGNEQYAQASKSIFGWGAVAFLPKSWNTQSDWLNLSVHYNQSDNFVPAAGQNTPTGEAIPSPSGESKDYGVSFYLFEDKVVARLNWYESRLSNSNESNFDLFVNQVYSRAFNFLGNLNRDIQEYNDPDSDKSEFPRIEQAKQAYSELETILRTQGNLWDKKEISFLSDGSIQQITVNNIGDTTSVAAKGFEAELILNPTPNWRIALNAAKQKAILDNYMPALTNFYDNFYNPYVTKYGDLENGNPAQIINPDATFSNVVNTNRFTYLSGKLQEGRSSAELRPWRFNVITNYNFSEGRLKGFGIGGALRWQDSGVIGFPTLPGVIAGQDTFIPDIANGYQGNTETNIDAF
ncbi:MAG: TonB-dependent receptor plug domain-containing protein, partial [Verrucomicrobia bacterium]|nr:TonB-dependent receptor plug domain-containing protein [Verrucomicrobiota bacterium]